MFDLSFSELLLIGIVAVVVVGPRKLPMLLRNAGHMIGRLRRMAKDLRTESGIDEILEVEGIRTEIDNFRRLAAGQITLEDLSPNVVPEREREYPRIGCDSYGAISEDLAPYVPALPEPSALGLNADAPADVAAAQADHASVGADASSPAGATPAVELPTASPVPPNGAVRRTDA